MFDRKSRFIEHHFTTLIGHDESIKIMLESIAFHLKKTYFPVRRRVTRHNRSEFDVTRRLLATYVSPCDVLETFSNTLREKDVPNRLHYFNLFTLCQVNKALRQYLSY